MVVPLRKETRLAPAQEVTVVPLWKEEQLAARQEATVVSLVAVQTREFLLEVPVSLEATVAHLV